MIHPISLTRTLGFLTFFSLIILLLSPVKADLTPGRSDTGFNVGTGADKLVAALAVEKNGGILVGGFFTQINGINQSYLARIGKDGSPTAFSPQISNVVLTIAVQPDSKILVGGIFSQINGTERHRIARLTPTGSLDTEFIPGLDLSGVPSEIFKIALQPDGKILIGGNFTIGNYQNLARLNADGSLDPGFQLGTGVNGPVIQVAVQSDGRILVGGFFTLVNGISRNRICRLNGDGSLDEGFNPGTGADAEVVAIAVQPDHKVIIGGSFQSVNGVSRKHLARLHPDGTLDANFIANLDSSVNDLAFDPDGRLLAVGSFSPPPGCPTCHLIARFTAGSDTLDPSFTPGPITGAGIYLLSLAVQDDGGILIGGIFNTVNPNFSPSQNNLARLNPDGTPDSGFLLANVNSWVMAAAVDDWGKTYLGGWFSYTTMLQIPPGIMYPGIPSSA